MRYTYLLIFNEIHILLHNKTSWKIFINIVQIYYYIILMQNNNIITLLNIVMIILIHKNNCIYF